MWGNDVFSRFDRVFDGMLQGSSGAVSVEEVDEDELGSSADRSHLQGQGYLVQEPGKFAASHAYHDQRPDEVQLLTIALYCACR